MTDRTLRDDDDDYQRQSASPSGSAALADLVLAEVAKAENLMDAKIQESFKPG